MNEYRFPGFRPETVIKVIFGDSKARVIRLVRTQRNGMRLLWRSVSELLRQEGAVGEDSCERAVMTNRKWTSGVKNRKMLESPNR